ncbi:MAG: hypothetical protein LBN12_08850 [Clostridiales Family XIII bacterium]|jgi:hypothetical protein|nr:hypothetical protein [Clostridiales Family XIII bacterium]
MKNEFLFRSALSCRETPDTALVEKVKTLLLEEETLRAGEKTDRPRSVRRSGAFHTAFVSSPDGGMAPNAEGRTARRRRPVPRALVAVVLALVLVPTAAFAAWHFLQSGEVADEALRAAFESDTAVNINESVTSGDYTFTLLAIVTGRDISDLPYTSDSVQDDRTYAVLAIQNADGTPRPATQDADYGQTSFFVSPLVKGVAPWRLNIATMNGGYQETVVDGIQYRLIECDGVAMFAERGVYLAVSADTMILDNTTFLYNEQTGGIVVNPEHDGASAVFDLPLSKMLADPEKAQQYLDDLDAFWGTPAESDAAPAESDIAPAESGTIPAGDAATHAEESENILLEAAEGAVFSKNN